MRLEPLSPTLPKLLSVYSCDGFFLPFLTFELVGDSGEFMQSPLLLFF